MRKVLSFVLVLALVLGSFSMAFASYSDMAGEDSSEAVDVLSGLGVVSGYPNGTFGPERIVTRAEMAKLIISALGLEDYATATSSSYSDMAGHWANGFVAYASSLGIIEGYPDGTFKPELTVTYEEACAMIVRALGYTSEFLPGGWPAEWVIKAMTLGILDGISNPTGGANRGDIAEMLYNALELHFGYVNQDGTWSYYDPSDSMLDRLGATFIAADDEDALSAAGFEDDGIIYGDEDTAINLRSFVGAYADRYLNNDDEIIKIVPVSTFLTGDYDGDGTFEGDDMDYSISSGLALTSVPAFYNGEYDEYSDLDSLATDVAIAVEVSGKTIKDIYSISEWEITNDFMIDEDILDEFADDETMNGSEFMLDDDEEIDMMSFELLGADSFADLEEDAVVYIYDDEDGYIRKIEVGTEVVTGDITKIAGGDITVGGKVYEFADLSDWDDYSLGDNVELALDYAGDIYYLTNNEEASGGNYAVLLETEDGNPTGTLSDPATDGLINLFLADGTDKIFSVDEDMTVASVLAADGDWLGDFEGTSMAGIIVEYGLDEDGIIDFLEVVSLTEATADVTSKGYYDATPIASAAVIFTFTGTTYAGITEKADADNYDVIARSEILSVDDVTAWYFAEDNSIETMMIFSIDDVTTSDDVYGVVLDWFMSTASDTDYVITMLVDGEEVDYDADEDLYMVIDTYEGNSDLYILDLNAAGELVALDYASAESLNDFEIDDYSNGAVYTGSTKVSVDSAAMIYYYNDPFEVASLTRTNLEGYYGYMYDLDEDSVADLILTFENLSTPLEYFTYSIVGEEAIITGYDGPDTEVIVPSTIEGNPVVVSQPTFPSDSVVTKVTLGDGVRVTTDGFEQCENLVTLVIGDDVIIENDGVCGCSNLTRIEIGSNVMLEDQWALCVQPNFVSFYNADGPGVYTGSGASWTFVD